MDDFYRQDFAEFINRLFASPQVTRQIAKKKKKRFGTFERISFSVGQVIAFYVATRSKNMDPRLLEQILMAKEDNAFDTGKLVARELGMLLLQQNRMPNAKNILAMLKNNIVDNALLMHATCMANIKGILEQGFDYQNKPLQKEKEFLSSVSDYEYDFRSNRLYVTSQYGVLFNFGTYSPEWVSWFVGDKNVVAQRNKQKALDIMNKKIDNMNWNQQATQEAKQHAQNIANIYFDGPQQIALVMFDRLLCDENGKRVFNRYDEEENSYDENAFTVAQVQERLGTTFDENKSIFTDPHLYESVAEAVGQLMRKTSVFEMSTLSSVNANDFSVAYLPSYAELANQQYADHIHQ